MPVQGNFEADNGETIRQLAVRGVGIGRLSEYMIDRDIGERRLVAVLEEFSPGDRQQRSPADSRALSRPQVCVTTSTMLLGLLDRAVPNPPGPTQAVR